MRISSRRAGSADFDATLAMHGMDRFAARKAIVARLEEKGLVEKIEPQSHIGAARRPIECGDRAVFDRPVVRQRERDGEASHRRGARRQDRNSSRRTGRRPISTGWKTSSPGASRVSSGGAIKFRRGMGRTGKYLSRVTRSRSTEPKRTSITVRSRRQLTRDEDVLDTWFSSALWPFSTLGWPDKTPELARYYPTSTLVTGFDIIFFWVARMMMMGLHFIKEVPFHDVYIHRLVRDASGAKMSKSKGNVVDPLGVIDEFGADALRFTLARNVAPGHDIRLGPQDVENNRNFATKLWNAARFVEFNGASRVEGFDPKSAKETLNRWIAHETAKAAAEITQAIEDYKFSEAAGAAYRFVWNVYCDWYVELSKPLLTGPDGAAKDETRAMAAWALDEILKLLHPFMPFITEELWAHDRPSRGEAATAGASPGRRSRASPTTRPKPRSAG